MVDELKKEVRRLEGVDTELKAMRDLKINLELKLSETLDQLAQAKAENEDLKAKLDNEKNARKAWRPIRMG